MLWKFIILKNPFTAAILAPRVEIISVDPELILIPIQSESPSLYSGKLPSLKLPSKIHDAWSNLNFVSTTNNFLYKYVSSIAGDIVKNYLYDMHI